VESPIPPIPDYRSLFYERLRGQLKQQFLKAQLGTKMETPYEETVAFTKKPKCWQEVKDIKVELNKIYKSEMTANASTSFEQTVSFLKKSPDSQNLFQQDKTHK
jgi:hypothetical protein